MSSANSWRWPYATPSLTLNRSNLTNRIRLPQVQQASTNAKALAACAGQGFGGDCGDLGSGLLQLTLNLQ